MIQANCSRRDTPECPTCARAGSGDYQAVVMKRFGKDDKPEFVRCLSYRRKWDAK